MLHTPHYDVRTRAFCGPTAMSAVTGIRISEIRETIRKIRGTVASNGAAMPVTGLANDELIQAMELLGWKIAEKADCETDQRKEVFRLGEFLDANGHLGPYIVNVTGHYYAVSHGEICDTFTCLPKPIERFRKGRARWIQRWWRFERV